MRSTALALVLQVAQHGVGIDSAPPALEHPDGRTPPRITVSRTNRGLRLDGRLDESAWRTTMVAEGFRQVVPLDGAEPSERTEVRLLYDDDALYIGARLYDGDPNAVVGRLGRRDSETSSDMFMVAIDSYHDHRTAFWFGVNPAGVRSDVITTNDSDQEDESWDPVWAAVTRVDSLGWVAEIRIPFSQLRFRKTREQTWGINFSRYVFRKSELIRWSWVPNTEQGVASHFGHLVGLRDLTPPRHLELLPYAVARSDHIEGADRANPFNDGNVQDVALGLDLKHGLTSDLTLDATVNPDFGQVEADPAVVNLTEFETFLEERRPFFIEGANLFRFGSGSAGVTFGAPQLFHSRRIGQVPSRVAEDPHGYSDNPRITRILGAAKLSGKMAGWSVGALDAVTAREYARLQHRDGSREMEPVEPLANYAVVGLKRDFREGATGIGILATAVHRDLSDSVFDVLRSSAYAAGIDFFHRMARNRWVLGGTISGSHISGNPAAITAAQRSSARYFQRPDQHYVSVDTTATALSGFAASAQAKKVSGNWLFAGYAFAYSPGFEVNDAGFEGLADRVFVGSKVVRRWLNPGPVFRSFVIAATWTRDWNFGWTAHSQSADMGLEGQFKNYWTVGVAGRRNFTGQCDKSTRGGPLMERPSQWSVAASIASDTRAPVSLQLTGAYTYDRYGGRTGILGGGVTLRPGAAVDLRISSGVSLSHPTAFYVTRRADPTATATFGTRYVFSELSQTTADLVVRADVALAPNLSIQLWAQPFMAAADYRGFKELARPESFEFLKYGRDGGSMLDFDEAANTYTADPDGTGPAPSFTFVNPDFRLRSLRGNLVVRWEYLPGSTLFLAWHHRRSGSATDPSLHPLNELEALGNDNQQNTLLVKLSYLLSF